MKIFGEGFQKAIAKIFQRGGEIIFEPPHKGEKIYQNSPPDEIGPPRHYNGFPLKLVHISDLHFGRVHVQKLLHLKKSLESVKPHFLLITGDIVDSPTKENFDLAKGFLKYISERGWKYFLVPGNHDRHGEIDLRKWCDAFEVHRGTYDCKLIKLGQGSYVTVFLLDSTIAHYESTIERTIANALQVKGRIDDSQLKWIYSTKTWLLQNRRTEFLNSFKIAALHHHPLPTTTRAGAKDLFLCLENAGEVLDCFSKLQIDLVLHGHQHDPTIQMLSRHDPYKEMTILGAGTALRTSNTEEEKSFSLSKETSFYIVRVYKDNYEVLEHTFANNLSITNKFCPTRGVSRKRTLAGQLPHELDMFWKINFPSMNFMCKEVHTFKEGADGVAITEYPLTVGFTNIPDQPSLNFNDLGCKVSRKLNGSLISITHKDPKPLDCADFEGKPYICFELKTQLDPPLAQGINEDVIEIEYVIPQGCWELKDANYFEAGFQFDFALNRFSLNVEFEGNRAIKRLTMLPLSDAEDEGVFVWVEKDQCWSKALDTTDIVSSRWKYEKCDIPPMTTIYYGITRT